MAVEDTLDEIGGDHGIDESQSEIIKKPSREVREAASKKSRLAEKIRAKKRAVGQPEDLPWLRETNPAIWTGDVDDDDGAEASGDNLVVDDEDDDLYLEDVDEDLDVEQGETMSGAVIDESGDRGLQE